MNYKQTLYNVFKKYDRMKKIVANPISQKLTQSFEAVVIAGGIKENTLEKMIIRKADAEAYMKIIDKAISELENTEMRPYQEIINYKYKRHYSVVRISIMVGYSTQTYFIKLRQAQEQLIEVLDLWGVVI